MANLKLVGAANGVFIAGYIVCLLLEYFYDEILPVFFTTGESITDIVNAFLIIVMLLGTILIPLALMIKAIFEPAEQNNPVLLYFIAFGLCVFTLALTYYGWFMIQALATFAQTTLTLALLYIGLTIIWAFDVLITPIQLILEARNKA